MAEYIYQTGIPEIIKSAAVILRKIGDTTFFAWKYEALKTLNDWLTSNSYFISVVQVYRKTPTRNMNKFDSLANKVKEIVFFGRSHYQVAPYENTGNAWYIGEHRNGILKDSLNNNNIQAYHFIENAHRKSNEELFFEIFFESIQSEDVIRNEFLDKAYIRGGEQFYRSGYALEVIERCHELGKTILAIEAYQLINEIEIQPTDYIHFASKYYEEWEPSKYFKKYHVSKNFDLGHWTESIQYIKDRADQGWLFDIKY